jgi:hypothetical protein
MVNFEYEGDIKMKNKYLAAISIGEHICLVSTATISRPPQSRETIPLNRFYYALINTI